MYYTNYIYHLDVYNIETLKMTWIYVSSILIMAIEGIT